MSVLVRVVAPSDLEGVIICLEHLRQVVDGVEPAFEELLAEHAAFLGQGCLMCGVEPVPGRLCNNEGCRRLLHPQWPSVYCSNICALEDV